MASARDYAVDKNWLILLRDMDVSPSDLLRRAGLPDDLFTRDEVRLKPGKYHRLCRALEDELKDPLYELRYFSPSTFRGTLQRRLSGEGTNFNEVLKNTCKDLSVFYLTGSNMTSAEISYLLGYESSGSFFRAFHDWTGMTPNGLRKSNSV